MTELLEALPEKDENTEERIVYHSIEDEIAAANSRGA
jgi:hypothetical protein